MLFFLEIFPFLPVCIKTNIHAFHKLNLTLPLCSLHYVFWHTYSELQGELFSNNFFMAFTIRWLLNSKQVFSPISIITVFEWLMLYLLPQTIFLSSQQHICLGSSWGHFSLFVTILPKPFLNLHTFTLSLPNFIYNKLGQNGTTVDLITEFWIT